MTAGAGRGLGDNRTGSRPDRQVRHQHLKLTVGLGRVGAAKPLVEPLQIDPAVTGGNPQPVGDSLPVRI
jgi:hypothetical protein